MFLRLGQLVSRHWLGVIVIWIAILATLRLVAPNWDDVTHDGDLAYLPENMPSVAGERLLAAAFPYDRAKSQMVVAATRPDQRLRQPDLAVLYDLARRFKALEGIAAVQRARRLFAEADAKRRQPPVTGTARQVTEDDKSVDERKPDTEEPNAEKPGADKSRADKSRADKSRVDKSGADKSGADKPDASGHGPASRAFKEAEAALDAFDAALDFDKRLAGYWDERVGSIGADSTAQAGRLNQADERAAPRAAGPWRPQPFGWLYGHRAIAYDLVADHEAARQDRQLARQDTVASGPDTVASGPDTSAAVVLARSLSEATGSDESPLGDLPLLGVWTWRDPYFGEKLISEDHQARLMVLQLSNEFMATDNIRMLELVEQQLAAVRGHVPEADADGLRITLSGSAAVGGDILRASAESIRNTELFTIVLVVVILSVIYRSPLLIGIPLISITLALLVSTAAVAWLTQLNQVQGFGWWELKVFTTTKIFIVVILFGAGTDYCLFLISRYREELTRVADHKQAMAHALAGVGDALAASALTTIFGLATMYFADFGKFRYSGPVIGLCLAVTLITCVTFTPALLCGLGRVVFWPGRVTVRETAGDAHELAARGWMSGGWDLLARWIVAYPGRILIVSVAVLLPLGGYGFHRFGPTAQDAVSYDFLSCLSNERPSKQGAEELRRHFPVGESGPLTVLVHHRDGKLDTPEGISRVRQLADAFYLPGVSTVRCIADPLGEFRPGEKLGVLSPRARRLRLLRAHPRSKAIFATQVPELAGDVTRLDLILEHDPFSLEAIEVLSRVDGKLRALVGDPQSAWHSAQFAYAGTTAGIRDLRAVTQSDNLRIELLVVLAVLGVLLLILRRPLVSLYMIVSVLFSFYVTIGATELFFGWAYGAEFPGLDWKVPLFLFVILVAIGQDYNVYLATRVFEEQSRHGPFQGLRRAVVSTGGIITSCGVIMAGTFISMTSSNWGHWIEPWLPWSLGIFPAGGAQRGIEQLGFSLALGVALDTFIVRPILVPAFLCLLCRWRQRSALGK